MEGKTFELICIGIWYGSGLISYIIYRLMIDREFKVKDIGYTFMAGLFGGVGFILIMCVLYEKRGSAFRKFLDKDLINK